jgi:biopolymer transport protein ExbD
MRVPGLSDPHQAMLDDAETLTDILNFIPMANQKIKALRDKTATGATLTANEQAYLNRIKQVPCLIKLALVIPPAPPAPVATPPAPHAAVPSPETSSTPVQIGLRPDGMVDFSGMISGDSSGTASAATWGGITIGLDELKSGLTAIAKANPTQTVVITGKEKATHDQLKKVLAICKAAKLKIIVSKTPPPPPPGSTPTPTPAPAPTPAVVSAPIPVPAPPSHAGPIRAVVRVDGKINFQGATYDLIGFKSKLEALMKTTPDQAIALRAGKSVPYENFDAVLEICRSVPVKNVSVIAAPPPGPAAAEPATSNLPAPALLMNPPTASMSGNAPPTTPSAPPATNAPPPAGP